MTTPVRRYGLFLLAFSAVFLSACQSGMQGFREPPQYHSPAGAYSIDLSDNTFRGPVTLDERCDRYGGSTTFWDGDGRMFRVDYLRVEGNPNIRAPRFASDLTLLNLVLNAYLRGVVAEGPMIQSAEVVHREFLSDHDPRALFTIVSLDVDSEKVAGTPNVSGNYYYGFMLYKKGQLVYLIQHRQPALMVDNMQGVLSRVSDAIRIPGKVRDDTEIERTRRMFANIGSRWDGEGDPVRLCEPLS